MDITTIDLPITEVTVLEDRAMVTRSGPVELVAGLMRLGVEGVSPTIVDKTLSVRVAQGAGARVVQARIARQPVTTVHAQQERVAALLRSARERAREVEAAQRADALAEDRAQALEAAEALHLAELAEDIALGSDPSPRMATLESLRGRIAAAAAHKVDTSRAWHDAQQAQRDAQRSVLEASGSVRTLAGRLQLQLHADAAGSAVVTVRYVVAGALWRPGHVATMHEDGRVELEAQACVWQATGEDWSEVTLRFSTERPSLGTRPPELQTDRLSLRPKSEAVQVQARDQVIATTGEGANPVRDEMPGVDDGGEPLSLQGEGPRTVVCSGRPHRVPLFSFECEAQRQLVCRPEKVEAVLLRTVLEHRGAHPLLAGPVELRRHGGFVGRTSTMFVAAGERFELGWGPEPDLRVHRKVEFGEHKRKPLSSWTRKPRTVTVTLSNLGPDPLSVELQERVMVSEIDKVEVELGPLDGAVLDDDGILRKTLPVRGFGERSYAVSWTVMVHDDVQGL